MLKRWFALYLFNVSNLRLVVRKSSNKKIKQGVEKNLENVHAKEKHISYLIFQTEYAKLFISCCVLLPECLD